MKHSHCCVHHLFCNLYFGTGLSALIVCHVGYFLKYIIAQSFGQTEHATISVCVYPGLKSRCGSLEQMGAKAYGDLAQPAEIPI